MKISYPSEEKGQIIYSRYQLTDVRRLCRRCTYISKNHPEMEAAYGLAIIVTMLTTTILFANYLVLHRVQTIWIYVFLIGYLIVESVFFVALMEKFTHGGYITLIDRRSDVH